MSYLRAGMLGGAGQETEWGRNKTACVKTWATVWVSRPRWGWQWLRWARQALGRQMLSVVGGVGLKTISFECAPKLTEHQRRSTKAVSLVEKKPGSKPLDACWLRCRTQTGGARPHVSTHLEAYCHSKLRLVLAQTDHLHPHRKRRDTSGWLPQYQ